VKDVPESDACFAVTTVVLSRSGATQQEHRRAFEDGVLSALGERTNARLLVVPNLYHLSADDPVWDKIHDSLPVLFLTWLPARATRWLVLTRYGSDRIVSADVLEPVCLAGFDSPETCAECVIHRVAGPGTEVTPLPVDVSDTVRSPRWYPVIDRDRCTGCGKCHDFCLFGVYDRDGRRVTIVQPDNCKPGCPACARVCPVGAIMFPEYEHDRAVSGAEVPEKARDKAELSLSDIMQAGATAVNRDPDAAVAGDVGMKHELDALIDALEELEL